MTGGSTAPGTGQMRFLRWHPWGLRDRLERGLQLLQPARRGCVRARAARRAGRRRTRMPGVWEVSVDARRSSDADNAPFSVTASLLGATVSPNPDVDPVRHDRRAARAVVHAHEHVRGVHRPCGRHVARQRTLGPFDDRATSRRRQYDVDGSGGQRRRCGPRSAARRDPAADLDLFVLNCTTELRPPGSPRTATPRSRSRSPTRPRARGRSSSTASRSRPARRRTSTSTSSARRRRSDRSRSRTRTPCGPPARRGRCPAR